MAETTTQGQFYTMDGECGFSSLNEYGIEKLIRLVIQLTNNKLAETRAIYDKKIDAITGGTSPEELTQLKQQLDELTETHRSDVQLISTTISAVSAALEDSLTSVTNKINTLSSSIDEKIKSINETTDSLDNEITSVSESMTTLENKLKYIIDDEDGDGTVASKLVQISEDISEMQSNIEEIKTLCTAEVATDVDIDAETGEIVVKHKDGTESRHELLIAMSDEDIDEITKI